jgi:hypothetical protein
MTLAAGGRSSREDQVMHRPFIEFLQTQRLPWIPADTVGLPGAEMRVLSEDRDTGACSLLVRFPAGWRRDGGILAADEEVFVIGGALTIGDRTHKRFGYTHLPAGYLHGRASTVDGAVAVVFYSARPEPVAGTAHAADLATERVVEHLNALDGEWGANFHPQFPPGAGRKWLRRDPVTKDETWVLGTMPLRSGRRAEKHPVVEEMFLLSGELQGHLGTMRPGAYFWRPPEEWHGPFGSLTGNLFLFRTVGGPLSTVYRDDESEFSWTPPDRPILPPDLAALPDVPPCACLPY